MILVPFLSLALASGCISVSGNRLTTGDLAKEVPEFRKLAPDIVLGYSPVLGARRTLKTADLNRFLENNGSAERTKAELCIERASRVLQADEVTTAMRDALGALDAKLELIEFSRLPVPPGVVEFSQKDLVAGLSPNSPVRWPGAVRDDENHRFQIWAMVRVTASSRRVIAMTPLRPGQPIVAGQIREEEYEGFPTTRSINLTADSVIGRVPLRPIAADAVIAAELLAAPMDVVKGTTVLAQFDLGNVRLKLPMLAERGGAIGDRIMMRHPATHKVYYGKVSGQGQAVIENNAGQRDVKVQRGPQ